MKWFRRFWKLHKWTGLVLGLPLFAVAATGLLLLVKKDFAVLQPPTQRGAPGGPEEWIPLSEVFRVVLGQGHPDFKSVADVDRVDFRPGKRVHKVRSKHHHAEIQIDAVTGEVLSVDRRRSDLIESIHDGSFFAEVVHDFFMPVLAVALMFLFGSGVYIWIAPILRRRRRRRERALRTTPS